jgi:undecaprenyl-diphosphatase
MLQRFDIYILSIINKYLRNKYMDTFMCIMTKLGDMGAIWIAIALFYYWTKHIDTWER